jgi:hypothetical protein
MYETRPETDRIDLDLYHLSNAQVIERFFYHRNGEVKEISRQTTRFFFHPLADDCSRSTGPENFSLDAFKL